MDMKKSKKDRNHQQHGGITDKHDKNAGSSAFNQGSEQDPVYNEGVKVSDEEKATGHTPAIPDKKSDNPGGGDTGKNNTRRAK
jgi:hypothetical protein